MSRFMVGQRWSSDSEPELGLATIVKTEGDRVRVDFGASGETRTYVAREAPLHRVRFRVGDKLRTQDDQEFVVREVIERRGLLIYLGDGLQVPESRLCDRLSVRGAEERLFAGRFDPMQVFELRRRTLDLLHRYRKSPVRGFLGGRVDLIPHQLYLAHEVASRHAARVMLSDEVGLGKTIEAGLILHRLLLSGRANRILVLVPEALVTQWFVEMLRRFNVFLHIFDEARCAAIEAAEPGANPFLDDQLVLTSIAFLTEDPRRSSQAVAAGWDLLVVDEAHHLEWTETKASRGYQVVYELSRMAEGLLLLTATPEQLGVESHFARLRLLDPERYRDLAAYQAEAADYRVTAEVAGKLQGEDELTETDLAVIRRLLAHAAQLERRLVEIGQGSRDARMSVLGELLDLHGPGRVLFRNTRSGMKGFPRRRVNLERLKAGRDADQWLDRLSTEFVEDVTGAELQTIQDLSNDPRVLWLARLLRKLEPEKVLLIGCTADKAVAIDEALRRHLTMNTGVFHEDLTLVQRDRNAAWFGEPDGARLLICSELGSEGRNFQFAHHLVLFDLPLNPELLEQRIGRLDRIGQTRDIQIYVPYVARSPQEVLARWYHDGLDAFESHLVGGNELLRRFGRAVHDLALEYPVAEGAAAEAELAALLKATAAARAELRDVLEQGRDRLLELNSFRPAEAQRLIDQIRAEERQPDLEDYLLDVLDHFGVQIEELAPHTWQLNPRGIVTDSLAGMPGEEMAMTCDRHRALSREDVGFLTWDHPVVTGAMDGLLGADTGNCAFAVLPAVNERMILLEAVFVLETVAAPRLHADRFLPLTPVRLVISNRLEEVSESCSGTTWERMLRNGSPYRLIENEEIARRILPAMLHQAATLAESKAAALRESALEKMNRLLGSEVERLHSLSRINPNVRPVEISLAEAQQRQLVTALQQSRVRLDSLRLIWKGPPEALD